MRKKLAENREHLTEDGTFQSDKYEWCPAGYVPIKIEDPLARDLLAMYATRRQSIDREFCRDLLEALSNTFEKQGEPPQPPGFH